MYKLYYANLYGRAEPIRILLNHAKIPFEDFRFEFSGWPAIRDNFEFKQVPALEITDAEGKVTQYTQSISILRYLAIRHGYYPTDDAEQAWEIDSVLDAVSDLFSGLVKIVWEKDPETKANNASEFIGGAYPTILKALSNRLAQNGTKFIAGDKITAADFHFGNFVVSVVYNELREKMGDVDHFKIIFEQHEPLVKYAETIKAEFGAYLETRPKCPR